MTIGLPLKAAHPLEKTKDNMNNSLPNDEQSGLRSISSKQIVNSNLRLAPPSSDLSAIISVSGSNSNSTKAKINLQTKDFEKLFSQNNEEIMASNKLKKQGGAMFMKNGRFCLHQDTTHCDPSCFDYTAQVNKLQSLKRQVRISQDEEEGRFIRKVAVKPLINNE